MFEIQSSYPSGFSFPSRAALKSHSESPKRSGWNWSKFASLGKRISQKRTDFLLMFLFAGHRVILMPTPSLLLQGGESDDLQTTIDLETRPAHQPRKETDSMPSISIERGTSGYADYYANQDDISLSPPCREGCGINFRRLPALKPLMMPPLMLLSLCSTFFPKIYYTPCRELPLAILHTGLYNISKIANLEISHVHFQNYSLD